MTTLSNEPVNNQWIDELLIPEDNCLKIPGEHCGSCLSDYEDSGYSDMNCCDHLNWRDKAKKVILAKLESIEQEAQIKGEIIGMKKAYRKAIMGAGEYHDDPYSYVVPIEHLRQYEADMTQFDLTQPIFREVEGKG
jgi:hypothetical protein